VAPIAGGAVDSAAGEAVEATSGAGAEVGDDGAAAPQAITNNVIKMEVIVAIHLLL
jgi:hypothetical protein